MSNFEFQDDKYQVKIATLKKPPAHRESSLPTLRRKPSLAILHNYDSKAQSDVAEETIGDGNLDERKCLTFQRE